MRLRVVGPRWLMPSPVDDMVREDGAGRVLSVAEARHYSGTVGPGHVDRGRFPQARRSGPAGGVQRDLPDVRRGPPPEDDVCDPVADGGRGFLCSAVVHWLVVDERRSRRRAHSLPLVEQGCGGGIIWVASHDSFVPLNDPRLRCCLAGKDLERAVRRLLGRTT